MVWYANWTLGSVYNQSIVKKTQSEVAAIEIFIYKLQILAERFKIDFKQWLDIEDMKSNLLYHHTHVFQINFELKEATAYTYAVFRMTPSICYWNPLLWTIEHQNHSKSKLMLPNNIISNIVWRIKNIVGEWIILRMYNLQHFGYIYS